MGRRRHRRTRVSRAGSVRFRSENNPRSSHPLPMRQLKVAAADSATFASASRMKLSSSIFVVVLMANTSSSLFAAALGDADYRRRHDSFTPRASIRPDVSTPARTTGVDLAPQRPPVHDTTASPAARWLGFRGVERTRAQAEIAPQVTRGRAASPSEHRVVLTPERRRASAEVKSVGRLAKFQPPSGSAASVQIGRTPSLTRKGTTAKLNRFVFRRAGGDSPVPR